MTVTAIVFNAGKEEYAISIPFVISIEKMESVNPVPHLPEYIRGVVKARGELIPVIDLGSVLYGTQLDLHNQVRMIIIHTEELTFGLLVNEAKEILEIPSESLQQLGLVAYHKTKYFSAIANLEDRIITMMNPISMLEVLEGVKEIKDYIHYEQLQL